MANHKRKGPKSTRAGCLHCKPHKDESRSQRAHPKYYDDTEEQLNDCVELEIDDV